MIRSVSEIKAKSGAGGSLKQFKGSPDLITACRKYGYIADVTDPSEIHKGSRDDYFTHLCAVTKKFLFGNPDQKFWGAFVKDPGNRKAQKILHNFGVRQELFSSEDGEVYNPIQPSSRRITLEEFYEICQIQFNFDGSFLSFKKYIQKTYGSFAEYCILKGYDINTTKWESDETALRVAEKLGSIDEIKRRCLSLYKYLEENDLLKKANLRAG